MTRQELYSALERHIPRAYSEAWDNDGALLLPNPEKQVKKILCTLDVSDEVVRYAKENGFDLILSHHPLIFGGLRALNGEDAVSRRVLSLLSSDVAVFSFHTRLDAVTGGVNDALAETLGLTDVRPMGEGENALGRIGTLKNEMPIADFLSLVKEATGAPALCVRTVSSVVKAVAVVGGEGKDFIDAAKNAGADTYLSGRLGYHAMLDGEINLIECGHYFSEKHTARLLNQMVKELCPDAESEIYAPNSLAIY